MHARFISNYLHTVPHRLLYSPLPEITANLAVSIMSLKRLLVNPQKINPTKGTPLGRLYFVFRFYADPAPVLQKKNLRLHWSCGLLHVVKTGFRGVFAQLYQKKAGVSGCFGYIYEGCWLVRHTFTLQLILFHKTFVFVFAGNSFWAYTTSQ